MSIEHIYRQFYHQLFLFILKKVGEEADAKDLVQDTFVKIWHKMDTLKDEQKLVPWIYQITRNVIIDHFRKQQYIQEEDVVVTQEEEEQALERLAGCLNQYIDRLPEDEKEIFVAAELKNIRQKELAEQYQMPYSSLRSKVQRSRKKIKGMLLDCCNFQFDTRGRVMGYTRKKCDDNCS